jgi:hypothetical protein
MAVLIDALSWRFVMSYYFKQKTGMVLAIERDLHTSMLELSQRYHEQHRQHSSNSTAKW